GFLIVVLGMVVVTALGVSRVAQVSERLTVINELNSVKQRYAINFRGSVHDRAISLRDVVLARTPAEVERHVADIDRLAGDYAASAEKLDEFFADDSLVGQDEVDAYAVIQGIEERTMPLIDEVVALRDAGNDAAAESLRNEFSPIGDMRASAAYRREVLGNLVRRFWLESQGATHINLESFRIEEALS
ncbi:MAG: MCP four helix bundle domain-containing protein, partial [Gammaproteobacteria bacterium]